MIAAKFKRYHMSERYDQQNFVLNTIWMIISDVFLNTSCIITIFSNIPFYLKWYTVYYK